MRIAVLYGPNLNLLGLVSRHTGTRLTLDKLNRALRRQAAELDVELYIHQTQSEAEASKVIQRQRNKVRGILLIPGIWAQTGQLLYETIRITELPLAVFHFVTELGTWEGRSSSIFCESAIVEMEGSTPEELAETLGKLVGELTA